MQKKKPKPFKLPKRPLVNTIDIPGYKGPPMTVTMRPDHEYSFEIATDNEKTVVTETRKTYRYKK